MERALAAAVALGFGAACARGQLGGEELVAECAWSTVDRVVDANQALQGLAITTDPTGRTTYVVGGRERAPTSTWLLRTQPAGGAWQTRYADADPDPEFAFGILSLPGELYVVGNDNVPCPTSCGAACMGVGGHRRWVVRRSTDDGATWQLDDSYAHAPDAQRSVPFDITADAAGNLWVVGYGYTGCDFDVATGTPAIQWLVRKRDAATRRWSTVDARSCAPEAGFSSAFTVLATESGVYVGGGCAHNGKYTDARWRWQVRRTQDGGKTWVTLDDWALEDGKNAAATDMLEKDGALYVVGSARDTSRVRHWIVRRSADQGATWSTVDNFRILCGGSAAALGIAVGPSGSLYVVGNAKDELPDGGSSSHWMVRRSARGDRWLTVDDYQLTGGGNASAVRITRDGAGRLLVSGRADNGTGEALIVRACQ